MDGLLVRNSREFVNTNHQAAVKLSKLFTVMV